MDSLSSVPPSIVLPPSNSLRRDRGWQLSLFPCPKQQHLLRLSYFSGLYYSPESCPRRRAFQVFSKFRGDKGGGDEEEEGIGRDEELERALRMDGTIPGTSNEFVRQVSSRAYDMRRNLQQTFDSSSYDVLEANPWRDSSKPVYVLTHRENQLCTMKTRRNRSEVERELGLLFSKGKMLKSNVGNQAKKSSAGTKFQMLVEDVREGVLVFEDENEAAKYCDLLQGGGQDCEGIAEIEASSVFDLCSKMRALAVLFRRGRTPPLPESLKLNLSARKRSLEDQEDLI